MPLPNRVDFEICQPRALPRGIRWCSHPPCCGEIRYGKTLTRGCDNPHDYRRYIEKISGSPRRRCRRTRVNYRFSIPLYATQSSKCPMTSRRRYLRREGEGRKHRQPWELFWSAASLLWCHPVPATGLTSSSSPLSSFDFFSRRASCVIFRYFVCHLARDARAPAFLVSRRRSSAIRSRSVGATPGLVTGDMRGRPACGPKDYGYYTS